MKKLLLTTMLTSFVLTIPATAGDFDRSRDSRGDGYEQRKERVGDHDKKNRDKPNDSNGKDSKDNSGDSNGSNSDDNGGPTKDDSNGSNSDDNGGPTKDESDDNGDNSDDNGGPTDGDNGGGSDEPNPEPEPETPASTPTTPKDDNGRGELIGPTEAQHWTGVCERLPDGRILVHTAFLRNQKIAHEQCRDLILKLEASN